LNIAVDCDGVLADFNRAYIPLVQQVTGQDMFPKDWEETLYKTYHTVWDYDKEAGYTREQIHKVWEVIKANDKFWLNLKPMPSAREDLKALDDLAKQGHNIYFLTNRMGAKAKYQTEKWLFKYAFDFPTVILTGDKTPLIRLLSIDFFIDDKPETMIELYKVASEERWLQDKHFYLKLAPYNEGVYKQRILVAKNVSDALDKAGLIPGGE